jgi:hypothetical protein
LDVHESVITPGQILCGYYFVSHQHRSVFWLDPVEPSQLTNWKEGIKDNDFHDLRKVTLFFYAAFICNIFPAEYLIESQYWYVFIFDIGPFQ